MNEAQSWTLTDCKNAIRDLLFDSRAEQKRLCKCDHDSAIYLGGKIAALEMCALMLGNLSLDPSAESAMSLEQNRGARH